MHKNFLFIAAILGAIAIALGAFGAHGLKQILPGNSLAVFETAVRYQFYHVFALIVVGILYQSLPNNRLVWAGRLFIAGIILFSGSLYLLTALIAYKISGYQWLGLITPLGGVVFIAGWILFASAIF